MIKRYDIRPRRKRTANGNGAEPAAAPAAGAPSRRDPRSVGRRARRPAAGASTTKSTAHRAFLIFANIRSYLPSTTSQR